MRNHVSKPNGGHLLLVSVPIGIMLAAPAFAATFAISTDWPNYLLVGSLGAFALGVTVKVLEGRDGPRRSLLTEKPSSNSIDIYRNSVLKP